MSTYTNTHGVPYASLYIYGFKSNILTATGLKIFLSKVPSLGHFSVDALFLVKASAVLCVQCSLANISML